METKNLKILVDDNSKIFSIQEEFNTLFPYLKLEFSSRPHTTSSIKQERHNNRTLGESRTIHNSGKIIINPYMTVVDLGQHFSDIYGLGVQVYRKSGRIWLETTVTEGWTLEEQNRQGEALSN